MRTSALLRADNPVYMSDEHELNNWKHVPSSVKTALRIFSATNLQPVHDELAQLPVDIAHKASDLRDVDIMGRFGAPKNATQPPLPTVVTGRPISTAVTSARIGNLPSWFARIMLLVFPNLEAVAFGYISDIAVVAEDDTSGSITMSRLSQLKIWDGGSGDSTFYAELINASVKTLRHLEVSLGHTHLTTALRDTQLSNRITTLRLSSRATIERIDAEFADGDWASLNAPCWCQIPRNREIYAKAAALAGSILACCPRLRHLHIVDFLSSHIPTVLSSIATQRTLRSFGGILHTCSDAGTIVEHNLIKLFEDGVHPALRSIRRLEVAGDSGIRSEAFKHLRPICAQRRIILIITGQPAGSP